MENIERENETKPASRKGVLVAILVLSIVLGCLSYILYLHTNWNKTLEELANVTAEKELVEARLAETEEKLEIANGKSSRQVKAIEELADEIARQNEEIDILTAKIEEYKILVADEDSRWRRRYEEYDTATEVWTCMKAFGWNDIVCAGIMGNLMAETGGSGTFNLDWDSNIGSGYGLVQWVGERRVDIKERYGEFPTVKEQVQFIYDELYGTNGVTCQVGAYELNAIMNAESPEDCAYAFACYYERCSPEYREMRREYARWAYSYFAID